MSTSHPRLLRFFGACVVVVLGLSGMVRPALHRAAARQLTPEAAPVASLGPTPPDEAGTVQTGVTPTSRSDTPAFPVLPLLTATPTRTPTPVNIGNFVWDDLDKDGRQDAGEPGLGGVTVQLWNAAKSQLLDTDVSDEDGSYTVVAPRPGDYRIRVLLPGLLDSFSPKDQAGGNDQLDSDINPSGPDFGFSDVISLASNVISTTIWDAGIIKFRPPTPTRTPTPINIGNFVWVDLNANGIQDPGEPGLGNVVVQLWNNDRTQLIDQTETELDGTYTVVAPLPGDYRIRVLLPTGASFAPRNQGSDDTKDSDINTSILSPLFGFSDTISLAPNVISTTIWDAGLINVPPTPTGMPPTRTPTATRTPAATPTPGEPAPRPELDRLTFLPLVRR
jgi:hypothetical protein